MRNPERRGRGILALLPLLLWTAGCGGPAHAPRGFLVSTVDEESDAWGGWVELTQTGGGDMVEGELIAVSADSLYLLPAGCPEQGCRVRAMPSTMVARGTVYGYRPDTSGLTAWGLAGGASTVSHGLFAVVSLPIWLLTSMTVAISASKEGEVELVEPGPRPSSGATWGKPPPDERRTSEPHLEAARYARFPQGLPTELRTAPLRPRPVAPGN